MTRRQKLLGAVALLPVLAAAGVVFAFTRDDRGNAASSGAMPPPQVSVAHAITRDVRPLDEFTGRVVAVETVELRPRVSGDIERVAYDEGAEVRKGDLLFVIDQRRYRAALDRATADLARARSEARLAQTEFQRAETLLAGKAISREEFEARHAANAQGTKGSRLPLQKQDQGSGFEQACQQPPGRCRPGDL